MKTTDGPKRLGRFIKGKSSILKKIALVDFDFDELSEAVLIHPDNEDRNIIHARYHPEEEQKNLTIPKGFEDDLQHPSQKRPVLRPIDFTPEWVAERKRAKQSRKKEDEEFNFFFQSEESPERSEGNEANEAQDEAQAAIDAIAVQDSDPSSENATETKKGKPVPDENASIEMVGNAINDLVQHEETESGRPPLTSNDPTAMAAAATPRTKSPVEGTSKQAEEQFIPASISSGGDQQVHDPEEEASKQYQNEIQVRHDAEDVSDAFEQAKAKGFETGFKQGEEKAEVHAREKTSEMMGKVAEILNEFKTLKHEVLNNVQENFYEIAQAVAEALLKREFRLNPETFAQVVRRAIDDALAPDTFKIKVHPETYELVSKLDQEDIVKALVKDPDIEVGDFKIESDLSVVDGNIRKVISELLQHADLDLFEKSDDDEKAG